LITLFNLVGKTRLEFYIFFPGR